MKKLLKDVNLHNMKALIKFEAFYKLLLGMFLIPCATYVLWFVMRITGYHYITAENILEFVKNPITILGLLLIVVFFAILTLFDVSAIIVINDLSYQAKDISFKETLRIVLDKIKRIIKNKNDGIAVFLFCLVPFLNMGILANVLSTIRIPEILVRYMQRNTLKVEGFVILYLIFVACLMQWGYSLHYILIEDKPFKEARKASKKLIKGFLFHDLTRIILAQLVFSIVYLMAILVGTLLIIAIGKLFSGIKLIESIVLSLILSFLLMILLVFSILSNAVSYSVMSHLFYEHKKEKAEEIIHIPTEENTKKKKFVFKRYLVIPMILAFVGCCIQVFLLATGKTNPNIEAIKSIEVTAHRGASRQYPENTMSAFIAARDMGADWIELDVQQTKDGQIVVSHDADLNRIAGIDKKIIDMTYAELKEIDVGSFFSEEFSYERIPLLSEVLKEMTGSMVRLNIELKPNGKEKNFEKQVVDIIKDYYFTERCVVTSQEYRVLQNIKKIDPSIQTVYVTSIAIGNITKLSDADAFSVESTNATKKLVKRIHNEGKEILVWTVNSKDNMQNMIDLGVDNIITDDVATCRSLIMENRNSNYITYIIRILQ